MSTMVARQDPAAGSRAFVTDARILCHCEEGLQRDVTWSQDRRAVVTGRALSPTLGVTENDELVVDGMPYLVAHTVALDWPP